MKKEARVKRRKTRVVEEVDYWGGCREEFGNEILVVDMESLSKDSGACQGQGAKARGNCRFLRYSNDLPTNAAERYGVLY